MLLPVAPGCRRRQRRSSHCISLSSSIRTKSSMTSLVSHRLRVKAPSRYRAPIHQNKLKSLSRARPTSVLRSSTGRCTTACVSPWQRVSWPRTQYSSSRAGASTWSRAVTLCSQAVESRSTTATCTDLVRLIHLNLPLYYSVSFFNNMQALTKIRYHCLI